MTHLLDTNVCVAFLRGKNTLVRSRFAAHPAADLVVCSVVVGELSVGAIRSARPKSEQAKVDSFLAQYRSLAFDDDAARLYAVIRADLEVRGKLISDFDMAIAAVAIVHDLTVITHNTREFSRVAGLRLEDWELP
jgi:tRNA(fMet)-specific endonuclease VapC